MTKRQEVESYLSRADIETFREWVARVVSLEPSELVVSGRRTQDKRSQDALEKKRIAAYLLFSASEIGMLSHDVAIIMKKSDPWLTASKYYIVRKMNNSRVFRADIERKMTDFKNLQMAENQKLELVAKYEKAEADLAAELEQVRLTTGRPSKV